MVDSPDASCGNDPDGCRRLFWLDREWIAFLLASALENSFCVVHEHYIFYSFLLIQNIDLIKPPIEICEISCMFFGCRTDADILTHKSFWSNSAWVDRHVCGLWRPWSIINHRLYNTQSSIHQLEVQGTSIGNKVVNELAVGRCCVDSDHTTTTTAGKTETLTPSACWRCTHHLLCWFNFLLNQSSSQQEKYYQSCLFLDCWLLCQLNNWSPSVSSVIFLCIHLSVSYQLVRILHQGASASVERPTMMAEQIEKDRHQARAGLLDRRDGMEDWTRKRLDWSRYGIHDENHVLDSDRERNWQQRTRILMHLGWSWKRNFLFRAMKI